MKWKQYNEYKKKKEMLFVSIKIWNEMYTDEDKNIIELREMGNKTSGTIKMNNHDNYHETY